MKIIKVFFLILSMKFSLASSSQIKKNASIEYPPEIEKKLMKKAYRSMSVVFLDYYKIYEEASFDSLTRVFFFKTYPKNIYERKLNNSSLFDDYKVGFSFDILYNSGKRSNDTKFFHLYIKNKVPTEFSELNYNINEPFRVFEFYELPKYLNDKIIVKLLKERYKLDIWKDVYNINVIRTDDYIIEDVKEELKEIKIYLKLFEKYLGLIDSFTLKIKYDKGNIIIQEDFFPYEGFNEKYVLKN